MEKIGVLGGTFNPPHFAHLAIAKKAIKNLGLKKLLLMVAGKPALKTKDLAPIRDRLEMTKILAKYHPRLEVSTIEIARAKKGKKSFTIETIKELKKKYPKFKIYWIIGEDSLKEILQGKWKGGLSIFDQAKFVVFTRENFKVKIPKNLIKKIKKIKLKIPISSTEIRKKIKNSEDISNMVPKKILEYIKEKKLYMNIPKHLQVNKEKARKIIQAKIREIKNYFKKSGFKKAIIGISGGLDSAVSCALVVRALGPKNVLVLSMPYYGISDKKSIEDALKLAKNLKIPKKNFILLPINKAVDASWQILKKFKNNEKIRKGNLMARERMKILFDLSSVFKAIVVGTETKSEEEIGYYTLWGDQASGIEPIKNLWKTQVYQLAQFLKEIPNQILNKQPSPGLWKNQTAENELGFSYLEADTVLSALKDKKMEKNEIVKKFKIPKRKINLIISRLKIGEIKKSIPYVLKS